MDGNRRSAVPPRRQRLVDDPRWGLPRSREVGGAHGSTIGRAGLGTGYLIYGPPELFGFPRREVRDHLGAGVVVFFASGAWPVEILSAGLTGV
jgi:hypothetical protein